MEIIALGLFVAGIWWLFARRGSRRVTDAAWSGGATTAPTVPPGSNSVRGSARAVLASLPGVRPLEVLVAAGETPSPEAIAQLKTIKDLRKKLGR